MVGVDRQKAPLQRSRACPTRPRRRQPAVPAGSRAISPSSAPGRLSSRVISCWKLHPTEAVAALSALGERADPLKEIGWASESRLRPRSSTCSTLSGSASVADEDDSDDNDGADDAQDEMAKVCDEPPSTDGNLLKAPNEAPRRCEETACGGRLCPRALAVLTVICGCACQAPYELMNSRDKGCAYLISLMEHLFAVFACIDVLRHPRQLSWSLHVVLAALNVGYTVLLNVALGSALPITVLLTIKSGNLVANMVLGICVSGQQFSRRQYCAVALVSAGLVLSSCGAQLQGSEQPSTAGSVWSSVFGVACVLGALLCRAASGMLQELKCRGCARSPVPELIFYRSVLGLPFILVQWGQITKHAWRWNTEPEVGNIAGKGMWALLLMQIAFDYATKVSVSHLIEQTSSLTASMVLTFQRFVAFIVSATLLSQEPAGWTLWLSSVAVMSGSLFYAVAPPKPRD
ncbi:unnamed protein product [Polarella glacialis]|uniref:Sugar phosphate transporter domain-containing protein n=2 Tax=Polarella glacialis TaxID=89957 RepID=A0A813GZ79_POLGL|nr:unnamed protein product [Polarella glacialis]